MRHTSLFSLSVLTLTGAFLFSGCTVERGYENYGASQNMMSQNFADILATGGNGYLAGQVGQVSVDSEATVDAYTYTDGEYVTSTYDLNVYDNEWAMAGLYIENGSLGDLELGEPYTFSAYSNSGMTASGVGCSDSSSEYFDENFEEVTILVEEGETEEDRTVLFSGEFRNGKEIEGGFNLSAE